MLWPIQSENEPQVINQSDNLIITKCLFLTNPLVSRDLIKALIFNNTVPEQTDSLEIELFDNMHIQRTIKRTVKLPITIISRP